MSATDIAPVGNGEIIEGTATELQHPPAVIPPVPATLAVTPTVKATELVARLDVIREASENAMKEGVDFGRIPGTDKPTLLKPGAEKLGVLFQLDVQLVNEKLWGPGDHLTVMSHAVVFHAPTGARLGYGEGICTTREKKYGKRKQERVCPECNQPAVVKGKAEYGGGWLCWSKRGGCNAKWPDGAQEIESQPQGEIDNPDLPDLWNTVVKMAEKRARVDAVLAVTGASALFTQDMEDAPRSDEEPPKSAPQSQPRAAAPQTTTQTAQRSERPVTAKQKSAINARCGQAGLSEDEHKAIVQWVGGVSHTDRLSSKLASKLLDLLGEDGSGAQEILNEISTASEEGDERAKAIVQRYFEVTPHA